MFIDGAIGRDSGSSLFGILERDFCLRDGFIVAEENDALRKAEQLLEAPTGDLDADLAADSRSLVVPDESVTSTR